jgi:hypothetical protein
MSDHLNPASKALLKHLKEKGKDMSWREFTRLYGPAGVSDDWARSIYRTNKTRGNIEDVEDVQTKQDAKEWSLSEELMARRANAVIKSQKLKIDELLRELERTNDALDTALAIRTPLKFGSQKIEWSGRLVNEGVAIAQFSDWHVGKRIERKVMNGLNEYNPDIAKSRSETVTKNLLKLIRKERQDIKINNLVINLGGDAIQNFLHEGDAQQNYFSPLEETRYAKQLYGNALRTIAENGDFKKIILLCNRGNHPRMTKKMQSDVDYKMNMEAQMYWDLADKFNDSIFEWHIPESDIGYYQIGDFSTRYYHGHQIGYQGGVGGLTIPLAKKLMYWDKTRKAHWNLMSHFHTFSMPTKNCSLNGSLCGYDAYAQTLGFEYEPPLQAFQLLDKKRGFTGRFPIHAE